MNAVDIFRAPHFRRLKILHELKRNTGLDWRKYLNLDGFNIVKFDEEVIKSPVDEAMSETIKKRYGEVVMKAIHELLLEDAEVN